MPLMSPAPPPAGPNGCLGTLALASGFVLFVVLPVCGVQAPAWVVWADAAVFAGLFLLLALGK